MDRLRNFISNITGGYRVANDSASTTSLEDLGTRTVYFNIPQTDQKFANNKISTGKYSLITFLPLFLFEQFRKAFNLFFLFICILQQIPGVSPTGRYTTIVPLSIILLVAAIKEIIEDYKRHRQDDAVNNRKVDVFRNDKFVEVKWTEVVVGDIVRVMRGRFFPADLVLLSSSEPHAMCYIETANLDGETNLKIRQGLSLTSHFQSSEDLASTCGEIQCEGPNRHLYEFKGKISLRDSFDRFVPLCNDQMLLRGAVLRNTKWVYGVAVYTGHETKLMKNANRAPLKMSNVDRMTNMQIWFIFLILITISLGSAVGSEVWKKKSKQMWYISDEGSGARGFFLELLTFIILYNNLVPISLLVTLEMVKFVQALFINWDADMYYAETDTHASARTSNLNEELGQVKYIFSDKTGTLTCNQMAFKKCTVAGKMFGNISSSSDGSFSDPTFVDLLKNKENGSDDIHNFATLMTVCHTVVPERVNTKTKPVSSVSDDLPSHKIEYQSSSPDETALVEAARDFGFVFVERTPTHVTVDKLGYEEQYEILNVLEFNSIRKRMSVITRRPDGKIALFCKGADNVIFELLADDCQYKFETEEHLREFACEGLRTLCFAYAILDEEEYNNWNRDVFLPASTSIHEREAKIAEAYDSIEKDLYLIGASAIEDRLQDGVPETISTLLNADIKLWVLTGDKQETAVNIAYSCKLFSDKMKLIFIDQSSIDDIRETITSALDEIGEESVRQENDIALVVNGAALKQAVLFDLRSSFLDLALSCKAVVCCRVSPLQKAEVVDMIKTQCNAITLAIGDGANDVSMIQAAHVGIGISGCEGLQAANSSDYSIAQFAYLQKLLLVHGSWNYTRLYKCILFSFYKNICLYLVEFWFAFFNGFSGQILFDRWTIAIYNVVFTSLPPFALGIFERTCSSENMLKYPKLYTLSQCAIKYNAQVFWLMFLNASVHSLMIFFLTAQTLTQDVAFDDGKAGGYLFLGNFVYTYVVVTVCLKAGLESYTWTVFTHIAIWGSILVWFLFLVVYSYFYPALPVGEQMVGMGLNVLSSGIFWFGLFLIPAAVLFRDLLWKILRRKFMKSVLEEVQELEQQDIDPTPLINAALIRQRLSEKAELLRNSFGKRRKVVRHFTVRYVNRDRTESQNSILGFAFSQEENGVVSQSQLIRHYNTSQSKPDGS